MSSTKSQFSSKIGFVLTAAGSAVGLGNLWRFPYLSATYGGGIFLFIYLILAVTFGFALMVTEIAIGRKTGYSAVRAYKSLHRRFGFLGYLSALVPVLIFPYYCVIGGWVTKYFATYIAGQGTQAAQDGYFSGFITKVGEPILWLAVFLVVVSLVVMMGVQKGIEKVSKFLMPALVVLTIGLSIYVMTLPGAMDGVVYYLKPDFSKFSIKTVIAALGQLFYSMSLAMGIMITYGSYMKKENNLESSVRQIEIFDGGIAFFSGLMIVPAVYAFSNGDPEVMSSKGAGLMFDTLPKVFHHLGPGISTAIGIIFFLLVFFAALTSAISLMETVVSFCQDKFGWHRIVTCLIVLAGSFLIALPSSLGYGPLDMIRPLGLNILDFVDFISNNLLMPVVALLMCIFVGWVLRPKAIIDEVKISSRFREEKLYSVIIRFVAPVFLMVILVSSVLDVLGIFTI